MPVVLAVWFAVVGGLAALAGLTGLRRVRHLRRDGVATWAAFVEPPARAGEPPDGSPALIRYTLTDGRVIERISPAAARKRPGKQRRARARSCSSGTTPKIRRTSSSTAGRAGLSTGHS